MARLATALCPRDDVALDVAAVLRLALGATEWEGAHPDWRRVYDIAGQERCAGLAWLRSGALIRRVCPAELVARWRALYLALHARAQAQVAVLTRCIAALEAECLTPIVLKGAPLAQRLYGDPAARLTDDLDVFIAAPQRATARGAMLRDGWEHVSGAAPLDELYVRRDASGTTFLELHSRLTGDNLAHLPLPAPERESVLVGGASLPGAAGPIVPGYLATHLAQHHLPPLLWLVDFRTLWHSLSDVERRKARAAARAASISGCLEWAARRAVLIDAAARGDTRALRSLGFARGRRVEVGALCRMILLSDSAAAAGRVVGSWLWPHPMRGTGASARALYAARARKSWRRLFVRTRVYGLS